MAGDAYGYTAGPPAARWQAILNASWPDNPRGLPHHEPIDVTARIVFEDDGEVWLDGTADRWVGQHVCVELDDPRLQVRYVWVDAGDVRRRGVRAD